MSQLEDIQAAQRSLEDCFLKRMGELEVQIQSAAPAKDTVAKVAEEFRAFRELMFKMLGLLRKQISECAKAVDGLETRARRKALIFTGFAEAEKEDCRALVLEVLNNKLSLQNITASSIKACHRLGAVNKGQSRSRPILVRFSDIEDKHAVWKSKAALRGSPVTVKEFLTRTRQTVFGKARLHFGMPACWTQDGVIIIKTTDGCRHKVLCMEDLISIIGKYPKKPVESSSATGMKRA